MATAIVLFSFACFVLGANHLLYPMVVGLFFLVGLIPGWSEFKEFKKTSGEMNGLGWGWVIVLGVLWGSEYLSPPIVWDAVLDHFHFAEEVARLGQLPFRWVNHTGDMPKFVEMIWAGFWVLGGEPLVRLMSALPALLTAYLLSILAEEFEFKEWVAQILFWTCPIFLALYAWGYVEGFLAFYEALGAYCLWRFLAKPTLFVWLGACVFFLGAAFSIKYTAIFASVASDFFLISRRWRDPMGGWKRIPMIILLFLPLLPWVLRNELANGNPVYPLMTSVFGGPPGYSHSMESNLWQDTGRPTGWDVVAWLRFCLNTFLTPQNGVGAAWTPLVWMSLPWWGLVWREKAGRFALIFAGLFFAGWFFFCTSLRHASGALLVLVWVAAWAWSKALAEKKNGVRWVFGLGTFVAVWLCFCAQLGTTTPYASALGFEDPLDRLVRNYSFNRDTYAAYRDIEKNSGPTDKVLTLGVFQTYGLHRMAFVDFYWKRPTFLAWAASCRTAEDLASRVREEGVTYFLYQREEAIRSFGRNKDWKLEGMSEKEYLRFWRIFMEPTARYENSFVYRLRETPVDRSDPLIEVPGLQEPGFYAIQKADFNGLKQEAYDLAVAWTKKYPFIAEGWRQRAQVAQGLNERDVVNSSKKAVEMGLRN